MDIRQLRSFLAVADTLNFSRAAQSLFLSQSALSRQIMDLEKEIGLPLFERNTRRVDLTEAGRLLLGRSRELLDQWDHLGDEVRDGAVAQQSSVNLSLGLDTRVLSDPKRRTALMQQLYALRRAHPGLRLLIRHMDYRELVEALTDRTLDCALILDRPMEHRTPLEELYLGQEEMVLALRSDSPCRSEDYADILRQRGLILVDKEPQGMHHIIRILDELGLEPRIHFCQSTEDMSITMQCGECAAILPESVAAKMDDPQVQLLHLPAQQAKLRRSLLWEKSQKHPLLPTLQKALLTVFQS